MQAHKKIHFAGLRLVPILNNQSVEIHDLI